MEFVIYYEKSPHSFSQLLTGKHFSFAGKVEGSVLCQSSQAKDVISLIILPNFNPGEEFTDHPHGWRIDAYHQAVDCGSELALLVQKEKYKWHRSRDT